VVIPVAVGNVVVKAVVVAKMVEIEKKNDDSVTDIR
jgi:hypothetical protein